MPPVSKGTIPRLLVITILVFLAAHAAIAFAYRPHLSDTDLYASYAFVFDDAQRVGRSPYDHYELQRRLANQARGQAAPRADEVTVEYPPLALELLRAPLAFVARDAVGTRGRGVNDTADWTSGFRCLYFLLHAAVIVAAVAWLRRRGFACGWGLAVGTAAGVILICVLYDRLDLCLGLALLGALGALLTGHRYLAMAALAVAVNLKLVPIFLLPLFVLGALPATVLTKGILSRRSLRAGFWAVAAFAATGLATFLPFRVAWGPRVLDFLAYHGQRGFQIESTWSSILLLAARLGYPAQVVHVYGADEVVGPGTATLAKASVVVVVALVLAAYGCLWRALKRSPPAAAAVPAAPLTLAEQRPQVFVWGSFAVLAAAMTASKVFSPQYLCWFLPALLLTQRPGRGREGLPFAVFLLACGLTTMVYPVLWNEVFRATMRHGQLTISLPTLRATLLMLGRNATWIAFGVLAVLQMRTARPVAEAPAAPRLSQPRQRRRQRRR
jgi:hypothetical protein